jgi:divalent metal cation (Fe/Co/Zn/Cd) transporter
MCIGAILLVISAFIAWRIKSLLVGRSADPEIQEAIDEIIVNHPGIDKVFNTITIQFGPDTMLAAKVRMHEGMDIESAVAAINAMERELRERIPNLTWCFVEPDVTD